MQLSSRPVSDGPDLPACDPRSVPVSLEFCLQVAETISMMLALPSGLVPQELCDLLDRCVITVPEAIHASARFDLVWEILEQLAPKPRWEL